MLSRHFLRSKVLQTLYSYSVSGNNNLGVVEKNFQTVVDSFNRLEINQINALVHLMDFAAASIEEARRKYLPTEADLNPSMRFVENRFINQIKNNIDFQKWCIDLKINLSTEDNVFHSLYSTLRESDKYKDYISAENVDYEADKRFALDVFKLIVNNEALIDYFNEAAIYWESDFIQNAQFTYALLKNIDESWQKDDKLPLVYDKTVQKEADDVDFARKLLTSTILSWEEFVPTITANLNHWDFDRVPVIDIILIKMAMSEFINFPSIPEPVTIDEYIELSKEFSTDRSKLFINGILDRISIELRSKGKIQKSGRGLYVPQSGVAQNTENED